MAVAIKVGYSTTLQAAGRVGPFRPELRRYY